MTALQVKFVTTDNTANLPEYTIGFIYGVSDTITDYLTIRNVQKYFPGLKVIVTTPALTEYTRHLSTLEFVKPELPHIGEEDDGA